MVLKIYIRTRKLCQFFFRHNDYVTEVNLLKIRTNLYRKFLKSGDLVFDIGANLGNRVEAFLQLKLNIIAVEPQPDCSTVLREKFGTKIVVGQKGVASRTGFMQMQISNVHMLSTFVKDMKEKVDKERFGDAI